MPRPVVNEPAADKRPTVAIVAICAVFFILGVNRLWVPAGFYFDERWYVKAALELHHGIVINREHPPLAKEILSAILWVFGTDYVTVRIGSLILATLGLFGFQQAQFNMTRSAAATVIFGLLVASNCLYFTTARIALLDPYMLGFAGLALMPFTAAIAGERRSAGLLATAGILIGLSLACKWTSLPLFGLMGVAVLWRWRSAPRRMLGLAALFGGAAIVAYLATFAPLLFARENPITLGEIPALHRAMYHTLGLLIGLNPASSSWWQWPIGGGTMWMYGIVPVAYDRLILMGQNPIAVAMTIAALIAALVSWRREIGWPMTAPFIAWLLSIAFWATGEKPVQFLYSYNLAAIFGLSILASMLGRIDKTSWRWISRIGIGAQAVVFVLLYPVLSAGPNPNVGDRLAGALGWLKPVDTSIGVRPLGNGDQLMRWSHKCLEQPRAKSCVDLPTRHLPQRSNESRIRIVAD